MTRMRMMGLALVAVFAMGAFAASSALALPEVGRCIAQAGTGKYKNSNCTEKAGTKTAEKQFEFKKGAKSETEGVHFTSVGGEGVLETANGTKVVCTAQSATGKYDQDSGVIKEVETTTATFTGCGIPVLGLQCNTAGKGTGIINTTLLKGPLGYISGEKTTSPVVGQELTPEKAKARFATFECGGGAVKVEVRGNEGKSIQGGKEVVGGDCIIAPLSAANVMSTTVVQTYSGSGGKQVPQKFQASTGKFCQLESNTNAGAFEGATQALETTVTNEEALEIKA